MIESPPHLLLDLLLHLLLTSVHVWTEYRVSGFKHTVAPRFAHPGRPLLIRKATTWCGCGIRRSNVSEERCRRCRFWVGGGDGGIKKLRWRRSTFASTQAHSTTLCLHHTLPYSLTPSTLRLAMPPKRSVFRAPGAQHFQLVHRSQRDPLINDPEASQRVLKPVGRGNDRKVGDSS